MAEKPILFNTKMVRAILDGRKTMTRRVCKELGDIEFEYGLDRPPYIGNYKYFGKIAPKKWGYITLENQWLYDFQTAVDESITHLLKPHYQPGDILWVRETWQSFFPEEVTAKHKQGPRSFSGIPAESAKGHYMYFYYRADGEIENAEEKARWLPSIHMPRAAARIFLRVTNVRVERLQEITQEDIEREGLWYYSKEYREEICIWRDCVSAIHDIRRKYFKKLWNSTIKKQDLDKYGWDANPWVWVVEFERVENDGQTI